MRRNSTKLQTDNAGMRQVALPPELLAPFHSLDHCTEVCEHNILTKWGPTHIYVVRQTDSPVENRPILINVHGGGWCFEHKERDIFFSRRMALRTGCLVIDVDYVLAPEYPYPAAIEQLEAFFETLPELSRSISGDKDRVLLCGQSAGANLLAAVCQRGNIKPFCRPIALLLCYMSADNYTDYSHGAELDEQGMITEYCGYFYNRKFEQRKNHDVSLVFCNIDELREMPPSDVITAGLDDLKPQSDQYFSLLRQAGVKSSYHCFEKSRHSFMINLIDEWREAEDYLTEKIMSRLEPSNQ